MRLLLCSDLYAEPEKVRGIIAAGINERVDLVCVAGDLIDFNASKIGPQCNYVRAMLSDPTTELSFAVCSGNHDFFAGDGTPHDGVVPIWMKQLGEVPDGHTKRVARNGEEIIVTTVPYPMDDGPAWQYCTRGILTVGQYLARRADCAWIILVHQPPNGSQVGSGHTSLRAELTSQILAQYKPEYLLCGHIESPESENGAWCEGVSDSVVFNAGQAPGGAEPQYIILNIQGCGWKADHSHY
jgi:hypothetical protein